MFSLFHVWSNRLSASCSEDFSTQSLSKLTQFCPLLDEFYPSFVRIKSSVADIMSSPEPKQVPKCLFHTWEEMKVLVVTELLQSYNHGSQQFVHRIKLLGISWNCKLQLLNSEKCSWCAKACKEYCLHRIFTAFDYSCVRPSTYQSTSIPPSKQTSFESNQDTKGAVRLMAPQYMCTSW